jgi:hypothetical protein
MFFMLQNSCTVNRFKGLTFVYRLIISGSYIHHTFPHCGEEKNLWNYIVYCCSKLYDVYQVNCFNHYTWFIVIRMERCTPVWGTHILQMQTLWFYVPHFSYDVHLLLTQVRYCRYQFIDVNVFVPHGWKLFFLVFC